MSSPRVRKVIAVLVALVLGGGYVAYRTARALESRAEGPGPTPADPAAAPIDEHELLSGSKSLIGLGTTVVDEAAERKRREEEEAEARRRALLPTTKSGAVFGPGDAPPAPGGK